MDFVSHLDVADEGKAMLVLAGIDVMMKTRPRWTQEDIAALRGGWAVDGSQGVAAALPHKTIGAIHHKARALGLVLPKFKRREKFSSTPHIDEAIRRYYHGAPKYGGLSKLAHQVGRPVPWVSRRAGELGIVPQRFDAGKWSADEIDLLRKNASAPSSTIARTFRRHGFHRTVNAINLKIIRLRCDRSDDDMYTAVGLAELFGVARNVVTAWITKGWLRATIKGNGNHQIRHSNVRRFVVENVGAVDIRRADKFWLVDLLAGNS